MIRIRISYDDRCEKGEALKLVDYLVEALRSKYSVYTSKKIYKNSKNSGGRIYMNLKPREKHRRSSNKK